MNSSGPDVKPKNGVSKTIKFCEAGADELDRRLAEKRISAKADESKIQNRH
jgi:hypothetical protein